MNGLGFSFDAFGAGAVAQGAGSIFSALEAGKIAKTEASTAKLLAKSQEKESARQRQFAVNMVIGAAALGLTFMLIRAAVRSKNE